MVKEGSEPRGRGTIEFTPPVAGSHIADEGVVSPGTGLDLAAPLRFPHAANLPFSDRGTGISFKPATAFAHMSNEPVQALGTGIVLETALSKAHGVDAVVRDASVTNAGYQGSPEPNQWFGGPELGVASPLFGRMITLREGSMVLRDAAGMVVDSLNYGSLVDPWAAAGDQTVSGMGKSGCFVPAPGPRGVSGASAASAANASAGRFPDGQDTGSNCTDFTSTPATFLALASTRGANNIKVASVEGFAAGQTIRVDSGANLETAVIAQVGTPGAAKTDAALDTGATMLHVSSTMGFNDGQTVTIGTGADAEAATIAHTTSWAGTIASSAPLAHAYPSGTEIMGTGLSLASPLTRDHARESQVTGNTPTPGAPNQYSAAAQWQQRTAVLAAFCHPPAASFKSGRVYRSWRIVSELRQPGFMHQLGCGRVHNRTSGRHPWAGALPPTLRRLGRSSKPWKIFGATWIERCATHGRVESRSADNPRVWWRSLDRSFSWMLQWPATSMDSLPLPPPREVEEVEDNRKSNL